MPHEENPQDHHVFLALIPYGLVKPLHRRFRGLSGLVLKLFTNLPEDLKKTNLVLSAEDYITTGMFSYIFLGLAFGGLMGWLAWYKERPLQQAILLGVASCLGLILIFLVLLVRMPSIQAKTKAEDCDKYLLYALKDIVLQIGAGETLFGALRAVGTAGYGVVSEDFTQVAKKVHVGIPMQQALQEMAERSDSDYLKKTGWQMVSSLRAGSDLKVTLQSVIAELNDNQKTKIMNYARELNLWSLVYMMFAVAIPTIGSTMMVILSTFAGFGVSRNMFIAFIVICFVIQFILVNFVKARRPVVQF